MNRLLHRSRFGSAAACCLLMLAAAPACSKRMPTGDAGGGEQGTQVSRADGALLQPSVAAAPTFWAELLPADQAKSPYSHVASIVAAIDGELIVVWGTGSRELGPDTSIVMSRRAAGESEWSPPAIVADRPDRADANPTLFLDAAERLHLYYVEMFGDTFCLGRVKTRVSEDRGRTWSDSRTALPTVCVMVRNRPIVTRSGRWVLPAYIQGIYASQFWLSDDAGESWRSTSSLLTFPENNLQPAVAELDDGSLFALMRAGGPTRRMREGRSEDGGETWTTRLRADLPNPNSGLDLIRLSTGQLLLVYNDSETDRSPLVASLSNDGGVTWTAPKVIDRDDKQVSYPSVCEGPDGMIHVVYTYRLERIKHAAFNRAWLAAS